MTVKVFDFFSGCGGTSCGFQQAGMEIVMGLDIDTDSALTFKKNFPEAEFFNDDIRTIDTDILRPLISAQTSPILFCGCAPCQPFSRQNRSQCPEDVRRNLLAEFGRFVKAWLPDYVFIENVPGMQHISNARTGPLPNFKRLLKKLGYSFEAKVIPALHYGVPQKRDRFVLLASRIGKIALPTATHGTALNPYSTVKNWIDALPILAAGETDRDDPDHIAAKLSSLNLKRITVTPEGGSRLDWPAELWLDCHKNHTGHSDVYGRLSWDKPAAGLTTKCISYSNGRFGHPVQNRALSVREAACLQTFPRTYSFCGPMQSRARQIGNAVPPLMAKAIGTHLLEHAKQQS